MKTITLTQEEYDKELKYLYGDKEDFENHLEIKMAWYESCKDHNEKCYERYTKAKLMLRKLQFEKYNISSIEIEGKGVDIFITYMEKEDGTPLSGSELDAILDDYELHQELMVAKQRI